MVLLGAIALTTLIANASSRLRGMALAFLAVSLAADALAAAATTTAQIAVLAAAGAVAAGILYIAASDGDYGEDPGWRLWVATAIAAASTTAAFTTLRTVTTEAPELLLFAPDSGNVVLQAAAFWLLGSGTAILVTARRAVRTALGALLMLTGVQLLLRLVPGAQLELTIAVAWLEVIVALTGAYLIVNERAVSE